MVLGTVRLDSLRKSAGFVSGYRFTGCGKTRCCTCFWVAQRFTAAITGSFSAPTLAAEVTVRRRKHFSRNLFSNIVSPSKSGAPLGLGSENSLFPSISGPCHSEPIKTRALAPQVAPATPDAHNLRPGLLEFSVTTLGACLGSQLHVRQFKARQFKA
jgi:hypothetical protein